MGEKRQYNEDICVCTYVCTMSIVQNRALESQMKTLKKLKIKLPKILFSEPVTTNEISFVRSKIIAG
jgi:hypothetical protein